jgi:hypothetical protein
MRIVKSWRAGVGKSLYKKRMVAELYKIVPTSCDISMWNILGS